MISHPWTRRSPVLRSVAVVIGLVLFLSALCAVGEEDQECPMATAWEVFESLTIDGDLGEWNTSSPLVLDNETQLIRDGEYWGGPQDLSARIFVMWDEANLYLGADVTEDTPFRVAEMLSFDTQDSFELYLSTNPEADPDRTSYETTDFRVILLIDNDYWDTAIDRTMVADPKSLYSKGMSGSQNVLEGFQCAAQRTTLGFTYEAVIPWDNFANAQIPLFVPSAGDQIAFNFVINDTEYPCPGTEYVPQIAWTGDNTLAKDPSVWGILVLE